MISSKFDTYLLSFLVIMCYLHMEVKQTTAKLDQPCRQHFWAIVLLITNLVLPCDMNLLHENNNYYNRV